MRFSSPGVLPSSGHPPHSSEGSRCPHLVRGITVLLAKDVMVPVPPADMKAGFFSPYFIVPKKAVGYDQSWVCASWTGPFISLLSRCSCRTASSDASVPKFGLQHWPERPVLPCVDPSVPQAIPAVGVRRTSISVQVLPFGLSLSPRVFTKVAEAALVPLREQGVRILNYLDDWLILAQSWDQLCEHRDRVLSHLSQLGLQVNWEKSRTLPGAEDLFSRYGVRLGQSDSAPHAGTRSVGVELLEYIQEQDGGTTETVSEAPGAYGGCGGGHAAGAAPYETASTLAPWPSPEVGVAERHAEGPSHSSLPPNLHPVVRPFIPSGRSAPGTGLQARCGLHRRLRQGLGGHVQRACSVGGLDGSPTALAHQLPRVAGSTPGLEPSQETLTRRACTSPYGQLCDRCVHQPTRWSTLPSHVTTRPPPPPLESEASEVASRHSYPGLAQPDSRRAVTSCAPRRMETPSPDGPADLATFWTRTGRPVRVPRDVALPVVLLPDRWNTRHGRTGTQLAVGPSQICISPSEPSRTDTVQGQRGRGADPARLPGLGSQSWCSSWQPLPGRFLWGRIYWLRDGAPYGTRVQTSGNFMSGP